MRRLRRGSVSSELLICGVGVRNIVLLPLVARCLAPIDVYIWRMFVYMTVVMTVWGIWDGCYVAGVVEDSRCLNLGVVNYVVCLCRACDGCCVFCLNCEAWSCWCSCMGSVRVSSCRCWMFVSCVHYVAVLNAAFCMTCSLLMLVEDARGDHMEEAYSRVRLITAL